MCITIYLVMLNFASCFTAWVLRRTWWDMFCNASGLASAVTVTSPSVPFFPIVCTILNSTRPSADPADPLHGIPQAVSLYCENWAFLPIISFPLLRQLWHPRTLCPVHYCGGVQGGTGDQSPRTQRNIPFPVLACKIKTCCTCGIKVAPDASRLFKQPCPEHLPFWRAYFS